MDGCLPFLLLLLACGPATRDTGGFIPPGLLTFFNFLSVPLGRGHHAKKHGVRSKQAAPFREETKSWSASASLVPLAPTEASGPQICRRHGGHWRSPNFLKTRSPNPFENNLYINAQTPVLILALGTGEKEEVAAAASNGERITERTEAGSRANGAQQEEEEEEKRARNLEKALPGGGGN
ncbi:Hypothetical predicted protein [Podarcis lilfordi]|uniref:Uncharacterized protein n=1 Tax=Podarcis lilfordi TaxID=74358 RepID=A0AA35JWZ7_9SAUR|nr:Hypothetical predicted protein [Podarcis lilfordi]